MVGYHLWAPKHLFLFPLAALGFFLPVWFFVHLIINLFIDIYKEEDLNWLIISIGQGILYRQFGRFSRTIPAEAEKPLHGLWHSHQRCLRSALASGPSPLLLDCHSFPARMSDVDICIGFNEDWSKPDIRTIEYAVNWFEDNGFKVGINTPYSNSIAPECSFRYHSIMLEINKKAYLKGNSILLRTRSGNRNRNLSTTIAGFMVGLLANT